MQSLLLSLLPSVLVLFLCIQNGVLASPMSIPRPPPGSKVVIVVGGNGNDGMSSARPLQPPPGSVLMSSESQINEMKSMGLLPIQEQIKRQGLLNIKPTFANSEEQLNTKEKSRVSKLIPSSARHISGGPSDIFHHRKNFPSGKMLTNEKRAGLGPHVVDFRPHQPDITSAIQNNNGKFSLPVGFANDGLGINSLGSPSPTPMANKLNPYTNGVAASFPPGIDPYEGFIRYAAENLDTPMGNMIDYHSLEHYYGSQHPQSPYHNSKEPGRLQSHPYADSFSYNNNGIETGNSPPPRGPGGFGFGDGPNVGHGGGGPGPGGFGDGPNVGHSGGGPGPGGFADGPNSGHSGEGPGPRPGPGGFGDGPKVGHSGGGPGPEGFGFDGPNVGHGEGGPGPRPGPGGFGDGPKVGHSGGGPGPEGFGFDGPNVGHGEGGPGPDPGPGQRPGPEGFGFDGPNVGHGGRGFRPRDNSLGRGHGRPRDNHPNSVTSYTEHGIDHFHAPSPGLGSAPPIRPKPHENSDPTLYEEEHGHRSPPFESPPPDMPPYGQNHHAPNYKHPSSAGLNSPPDEHGHSPDPPDLDVFEEGPPPPGSHPPLPNPTHQDDDPNHSPPPDHENNDGGDDAIWGILDLAEMLEKGQIPGQSGTGNTAATSPDGKPQVSQSKDRLVIPIFRGQQEYDSNSNPNDGPSDNSDAAPPHIPPMPTHSHSQKEGGGGGEGGFPGGGGTGHGASDGGFDYDETPEGGNNGRPGFGGPLESQEGNDYGDDVYSK